MNEDRTGTPHGESMAGNRPASLSSPPSTMKVVELAGLGDPSVLRPATRPVPVPGPGDLLVRVGAVGVCGHDVLARRGELAAHRGDVLGHEISGTVVAVGPQPPAGQPTERELESWIGVRVALVQRVPCGSCPDCLVGATSQCRRGPGFYGDDIQGGYAEYVLASPLNAVPVPDSISDVTAAVLSCGVGTGFHALATAELAPGDVVVVTGAGGGVGLHTVDVAVVSGYKVVAITGTKEKAADLERRGAHAVLVDPDVREVREAIGKLDRPRGADAVIEVTGLPTFALGLRSLAPRGRLTLVGNVDPGLLPLDPGLTIVKELQVRGSAHATRADLQEVVRLVADGRVEPMTRTWSLDDVGDAHRALEARHVVGRAVVVP